MREIVLDYLSLFVENSNDMQIFSDSDVQFIGKRLTHHEEREETIRDLWGNWEHTFTQYNYQIPYVDQFVLEKLKTHQIKQKSIWPKGKKFAVHISHDVDFVNDYSFKEALRNYTKLLKYGKLNPKTHLSLVYAMRFLVQSKRSLFNYNRWLETIAQYGFTSTFYYFIRPSLKDVNQFDVNYHMTDKVVYKSQKMTVAEMAMDMQKDGFGIGLHTAYHAYDNATLTKQLKETLEHDTNLKIHANRQHFLHFDMQKTPSVLSESEIRTDSTLGFNRNIGFRAGTAFPYFLADKELNKLNVLEIPMHIMDGALFTTNALELDEKMATRKAIQLIDEVENVGGCITLNFHPHVMLLPTWWNVFCNILKELSNRDVACIDTQQLYSIANYKE
ncbi:MAG: hypothetical protein R2831_07775 [Chitinophagaceae bacterium]